MVEAGTQRKNIQILTGIGFIISIGLLIFFKQHPTYFQVGGIFQSSLGQLGFFAPLIFVLLQVVQVVYPIIPGGMTSVLVTLHLDLSGDLFITLLVFLQVLY